MSRPIKDRLRSWKEIFWNKAVWITLTVYSLIGLFDLLKAEFLPDKYQSWTVVKLLPSWSWRTWLVVLLMLVIGILLEGAHAALKRRDASITVEKRELEKLKEEVRQERDRYSPKLEGISQIPQ
jgi:hypothetical protein